MGGSRPDLLEVGRINRPHALAGELVVQLTTDLRQRLDPGSVLHTDAGPLEVVSARPHQQRWIVRFAGVDDRASAEALQGLILRAEPADDPDDPDALWIHRLIGSEVRTPDGAVRGRVQAVEANPASDLLVLDTGALVPLTFVVDHATDGVLVIDPPAGLLDL